MHTADENIGMDQRPVARAGGVLKKVGSRLLDALGRDPKSMAKETVIALLVVIITVSHYQTERHAHLYHVFYQGLYFLPVILSGFWFGLRGGLITSLGITLLYTPFTIMYWSGFSAADFNNLMEMVLYNVVAVMLGILRDQERTKQRRLMESERLAAMGSAVSCLAHDMKTPLIAIGGFTRLVQKQVTRECQCDSSPCIDKLDIVVQETQRLENMVRDMLDFAKPLELTRSREDIRALIEESIMLLEDQAREKGVVLLRTPTDPGLPAVSIDAMRMKQVFINLVSNAIQASPEGGAVEVNCWTRGNRLIIDVCDNGCGIPPGKRGEVFLPFVSTKKEGTGLGLPIVQKILEAHGGRVEILDNNGGGLIFRVTIPCRVN